MLEVRSDGNRLRNLSDIKPYPGNPRQNDAAVDAVAESIRRFGLGAIQASGTAGPHGREKPTGPPPGRGDKAWGMARPNTASPRGTFLGEIGEGGSLGGEESKKEH